MSHAEDFSRTEGSRSPGGMPARRPVGAVLRSPLRGKLRRIYLTTFRAGYVREQNRRRKGECRQCGSCCRLLFRCFSLTPDDLCRTYSRRSAVCSTFPIDERDLRDVGPHCGYYFDGMAPPKPAGYSPLVFRVAAPPEVPRPSILLARSMEQHLPPKTQMTLFCGQISVPITTLPNPGATNRTNAVS